MKKATKRTPGPKQWDPAWWRYAGLYRSVWGDTEVVEGERELLLTAYAATGVSAMRRRPSRKRAGSAMRLTTATGSNGKS